jgi:uncharacterized protein (DUF488 family)
VRPRVFSIGHSTRSVEELLQLLHEHGVRCVVDVRRFPVSRRLPQFGRDRLGRRLSEAAVEYRHEPDLGGHREPRAHSPNTGWSERAFRGYADHMASRAFQEALLRLLSVASETRVAVLCAEADPRRCHRQLLADALVIRGAEAVHILGAGQVELHVRHPLARLGENGQLVYDRGAQLRLVSDREGA